MIKLIPIILIVICFLILIIPTTIYASKLGQKINEWLEKSQK